MAAFRPTLLVLGLTLGHTLPPPPSPNACRRLFPPLSSHRSPLRLLREHMQQHARVLSSAEAGEASDGRGAASAEASVASWGRLWRELRLTARLGFVLPASAISLLLGVAELVAPRIRGDLFDTVVRSGVSFAQLAPQLRLLGLLAIVGWAGSIVSSVLFASARWASCMTGRLRLMQAVLAQEAAFFDRQPPGELASRLMSEPDRLEEIANRGIEKALNALLALCGGLGLMLLTEWRLALLALVLRAPLLARLAVVAGRVVGLYGVAQQRALNAANALAAEALAQAQTVVAHAAVRSVLDEYDGRVREYMRVIQCTLVSETALRFTRLAIDSLATWLMLAAGLHAVLHHRLTLGALTAFYTYSDVFARGCTSAQEVVSTLCTMRPACARYFELLDRSPAMAWGVGATPDRCEGALEVRNVSFAYAGRREGALHGVSFRVPAGTSLAIVGPSGAGKSSLLKLLLRLYDPDEGQVLLDGVDLRCLELGWMRSRFGYVPQQPLLFDATIAENVCFGEPGTVDEESVAVALQAACAAAFVARLPDGVRTRVGEGGKHLSGGQRQRIAIARALVRRPRVLLWDEATSSLDGESERAVQATMQAALRDGHAGWRCSAVVVAHRLSSVLCADMVLVLREGRVEEFGSPSELSHAGGWFEQNFFGASRDHQGATGQEV